jgi:hypothetical protein
MDLNKMCNDEESSRKLAERLEVEEQAKQKTLKLFEKMNSPKKKKKKGNDAGGKIGNFFPKKK